MCIGHGRHEEMLSLPRATDMFDEEKVPSKFGVFPLSGLCIGCTTEFHGTVEPSKISSDVSFESMRLK
jgi:hypothetical protein